MITRQKGNLCYKICVASSAAPLFLLGNQFSDNGATVTSLPEDIGKVTCPGSAIFYTDQDSDLCLHWTPIGVSHTFSNSTPWTKRFITIGQRSCERISNMCVSGCAFELNKQKYSGSTRFYTHCIYLITLIFTLFWEVGIVNHNFVAAATFGCTKVVSDEVEIRILVKVSFMASIIPFRLISESCLK